MRRCADACDGAHLARVVELVLKLAQDALTAPPSTLASELDALLVSGDGADVTLCCGEERFSAHSFVLCLRSPVFRAQLRGPLAPETGGASTAVPVPDFIQPPILRRLLHFIYADDTLEPSSAEEAQHLLAAGDHYGLTRLVALCAAFLSALFTVDNVALTLTLADQHGLEDLKARALRSCRSTLSPSSRRRGGRTARRRGRASWTPSSSRWPRAACRLRAASARASRVVANGEKTCICSPL